MSLTATLRPAGVAASRWPLRLALAAGAVLAAAALLGGCLLYTI